MSVCARVIFFFKQLTVDVRRDLPLLHNDSQMLLCVGCRSSLEVQVLNTNIVLLCIEESRQLRNPGVGTPLTSPSHLIGRLLVSTNAALKHVQMLTTH